MDKRFYTVTGGKKIDYAIFMPLDKDGDVKNRMRLSFESRGLVDTNFNLNHMRSDHVYSKHKLLVISIEAKAARETINEVQTQMAIWEHGRMNNLHNLMDRNQSIADLLPMVSVIICDFACMDESEHLVNVWGDHWKVCVLTVFRFSMVQYCSVAQISLMECTRYIMPWLGSSNMVVPFLRRGSWSIVLVWDPNTK